MFLFNSGWESSLLKPVKNWGSIIELSHMRGLQSCEKVRLVQHIPASEYVSFITGQTFFQSHFFGTLEAAHMGELNNRPPEIRGFSPVLDVGISSFFFNFCLISIRGN